MVLPIIAGVVEASVEAYEAFRVAEALETVGKVGVAMEGIHEVYNDTTDTWHTVRESAVGRKIADEFGNDEEFINNTQIPEMSNKSQRTTSYHGAPGATARTTKVPTVTTYAHKSPGVFQFPGKTKVSMKRSTPTSGKLSSALTQDQKYFDSNLLVSTGENRLTSLNVKLGKQIYPDVISPFLQALNGHGKVQMQFGGRCISTLGNRHTSMQMFRHNLSSNTTASTAYPTAMLPFILTPGNPTPFYPGGGTTGGNFPIGDTSMRDCLNNKCYWAPYNLSDLEDCSWNLNKLKLGQERWAQAADVPVEKFQVPIFQANSHARKSAIFTNNDLVPSAPSIGSTAGGAAPYRYNAVLNKGSVHYDFMNKGTGGAKVEIIIYRVKKSNTLNATSSGQLSTNNDFCNNALQSPIGLGYIATQTSAAGTDALNGRVPLETDVYQKAAYPLLPKLKKTKQMDQPFVEVVRQTFAMPSGSRREVTFDLPGEVYDPNNQMGSSSAVSAGTPPILNHHMYAVYLSVSGVVCTDQVTPVATSADAAFNVGDVFSAANVQFYGTYTEFIGACQYNNRKTPNLYSCGALIAPSDSNPATFGADVPITMVDQNSAVRLPAQSISNNLTANATISPGHNLTNDFAAVAT